jgi:hypothetical protein
MDGVTGFSVVDPGGNWIRINAKSTPEPAPAPTGRMAIALENAVVQADSRGDHQQAARILDTALARPDADADPAALLEALVYRAEVALTLEDPGTAGAVLSRAAQLQLPPDVRRRMAATLSTAAELAATLP